VDVELLQGNPEPKKIDAKYSHASMLVSHPIDAIGERAA